MLESAWLMLGTMAFVWTVLIVFASAYFPEAGNDIAMVGGTSGAILWGVWTFGTLQVEVVEGATVYEFAMPSLTLVGLVMAIIPLYVAVTGPVELMARYRDPDQREI